MPVVRLDVAGYSVVELWHGPTLAFKDFGLQVMGALIDWFLGTSGQTATILVGTSGALLPCSLVLADRAPGWSELVWLLCIFSG